MAILSKANADMRTLQASFDRSKHGQTKRDPITFTGFVDSSIAIIASLDAAEQHLLLEEVRVLAPGLLLLDQLLFLLVISVQAIHCIHLLDAVLQLPSGTGSAGFPGH